MSVDNWGELIYISLHSATQIMETVQVYSVQYGDAKKIDTIAKCDNMCHSRQESSFVTKFSVVVLQPYQTKRTNSETTKKKTIRFSGT